jgi:hypothetical protein
MQDDISGFCDLITSMKIEDQQEVALSTKIISEYMLALFESIMEYVKANHLENEVRDEFKIQYITLLLRFQRKRVVDELKNNKFPLRECLQLCEKEKHELAIAYLKDRLGNTQEALDIYKKR